VAYQTAYLKAHYTPEYMAAVLSNNQGNIEKITFFMEESRNIGIPVLGPDVNESDIKFAVNKNGEIRFALSAIKGVGEAAVESLIEERKKNGPYKSIFDLTKRCNLRSVNKKSIESLALAGAFDGFGKYSRAQYVEPDQPNGASLIEKAIRYGSSEQNNEAMNQQSLFGGSIHVESNEPAVVPIEEWPLLEKLKREKEVVGIYISGHPLDDYRLEIKTFTNCRLADIPESKDKELRIAGIIGSTNTRISKTGNQFVVFQLEDFDGQFEFALFGKDYVQFKNFAETLGAMVYITGRYQTRYNQPDNFEFKISKIELLSETRNTLTKKLTIRIDNYNIQDRITDDLTSLFGKYPGKLPVVLKIVDEQEEIVLSLNSRKFLVDISNDFLKELKSMEELSFSLN
jgi:DNA polymerase-3 subunit alpha